MMKTVLKWLLILAIGLAVAALPIIAQKVMAASLATSQITGGLGSAATAQYPWSGTCCIVIDDGFAWTYDDLLPMIQDINDDFGLTGTPWEIHMTSGINVRGPNGIQGFEALTGSGDLPPTGDGSANSMTVAEVRALYSSGLFEIASHGKNHILIDNMELPGANGPRVRGPWPVSGILDSTTVSEVRDSFYAIRDTLGIPDVWSMVAPFHRTDNQGRQVAAHYYKNYRRGNLWHASTFVNDLNEFPPNDNRDNSTNNDRGIVLHFNRTNNDPISYPYYLYDIALQGIVMPTTPMNRLNMPHLDPPANGSTQDSLNVSQTMDLFDALAETKGFAILTWHDMNNSPPAQGANQDLGGLPGVDAVMRYGASLCANGKLAADGPKLQFLMLNEGTNKKCASVAYIDGAINVIDNFRMLPGRNSDIDGDGDYDRPYGYPDFLAQPSGAGAFDCWADSGWAYVDPTTARAPGGWFGYFNDTGLFATPRPGTATNEGANFSQLIQFVPVIPGSYAHISCYAWTDTLTIVKDGVSDPAPHDSLSACWINIDVIPMRFNQDPTDSLVNFIRSPGSPNMLEQNVEIGEVATSDYTGSGTGATSSTNAFSRVRLQHRFHSRDQSRTMRSEGPSGWSNPWYNDDSSGPAPDRDQRWRPFERDYIVPNDAYWLRIAFIPTGWTNTTSDSLAITGIECQLTPR